ncbi:MAG: DNA alkylation repair protein [Sphaerochaetaceae bacterium]|nr:DNA alkylation repair protein [Sphaerochaetaceae bacterium]
MKDRLFALQDAEYADFQSKLTPNVPRERFIGVRVPAARNLAKQIMKEGKPTGFLKSLPHDYFEEDMLHGLLISQILDYDECILELERFLPFVDNWAVCDTMSPKVFRKHRTELLQKIPEWISSDRTYTCRFGIGMLMAHFLDEDFKPEYLELPAMVKSEEYYVRMMVAWYFATALAKQWDYAVNYLQDNRLETWTHNKAIQKALESYRITAEQKDYLRTLKKRDYRK